MRRLFALKLLFAAGVLFISSCGIQTKLIKDFRNNLNGENQTTLKTGRVWIRSFTHTQIGSVTSVYVAGSYGGSASGLAVGRNKIESPSQDIISVVRNSGIFESVTPIETGAPYDFILEGNIDAKWKMPWWTYVQLIDIWVHAWVFPTLGRDLVCNAEIIIYDKDYKPVYSASVNYTKKYIGHIWWLITHGGNFDTGSDVAVQKEVLEYAFTKIKDDMKLALTKYYELNELSQNNGKNQNSLQKPDVLTTFSR